LLRRPRVFGSIEATTILTYGEFPALSGQVMRIQSLTGNEREKTQRLTDEILKDVALTKKLLRLANSALLMRGGEGVATVSRAVAMLGFTNVRNLSLSLVLLEHLSHKGQQQLLLDAYQKALFSATLASAWSGDSPHAEEVFLGAMFQGLGPMLLACFFPDEAAQLQALVAQDPTHALKHEREILGVELEQLTLAVARSWNFPDKILRIMQAQTEPLPTRLPHDPVQSQRWLATMANQAAQQLLSDDTTPERSHARVDLICRRYARVLHQPIEQMQQGVLEACMEVRSIGNAVGMKVPAGVQDVLIAHEAPKPTEANRELAAQGKTHAPLVPLAWAPPPAGPAAAAQAKPLWKELALGLERAHEAWFGGGPDAASKAQLALLESFYNAFGCQTLVLCWRSDAGDCLQGVQGLGPGAQALAQSFRIALDGQEDLFALLCAQPRDTLIEHAGHASVRSRLPAWFTRLSAPDSMMLLPIKQVGALVGAVYVGQPQFAAQGAGEQEVMWLRVWKNQLMLIRGAPSQADRAG
ncbi:HDOD domain-containing protein, partial [Serpentinimonas barnesii]|uniref:HDOD domain-containing protein n=1 Tax=Serpentinimonas barnesii TaxID=1458427 RepID=UPI0011EA6B97